MVCSVLEICMKKRPFHILLCIPAALAFAFVAERSLCAESSARLVVVELFTSQGCSSCPAAYAFLGELIEMRDDVLGLELHVDYWDNLGWKDRFSSAESTARQRACAKTLGLTYVYTPQMVINGSANEVGSDKMAVIAAIENAHKSYTRHLDITLAVNSAGGIDIAIPAADSGSGGQAAVTVWLVNFDRYFITDVTAGENDGRKMNNNHVVRGHKTIGTWHGDALNFSIDADQLADMGASDGCAVLVQSGEFGAIFGAAALWLDGAS
jgi:hypothetical protein